MKVMTVLGTRPEVIRLSLIIEQLDKVCDHILVHTGQNFDSNLNDIFFQQLGVRQPDFCLGIHSTTFGEQAGRIIAETEKLMLEHKPDRVLILGDTNSGLAAIPAKRHQIPVYHMEAGNRCFDDRVPEEVNRRIIDHSSDVLMPYTERSRANLLAEGIPSQRIYVTGNPIWEVLERFEEQTGASDILDRLELKPNAYFLVTIHRAENVDLPNRLKKLLTALTNAYNDYGLPVVVSTHPRTRSRLMEFGFSDDIPGVRFLQPFGFFDFVNLEKQAFCVLTDSGTVQEECSIFGVPNVTVRDTTERPETVECGSNVLSGLEPESIRDCIKVATLNAPNWEPPPEYVRPNVSDVVVKIVTAFNFQTTLVREALGGFHNKANPAPTAVRARQTV